MDEIKTIIPIYRAMKIDSDEWVEGYYFNDIFNNQHFVIMEARITGTTRNIKMSEVDPSTLAIHFPDMIDSEGTKIFASLSEDGRGGDFLHKIGVGFFEKIDEKGVAINMRGNCYIKYIEEDKELLSLQVFHTIQKAVSVIKVTGIQE